MGKNFFKKNSEFNFFGRKMMRQQGAALLTALFIMTLIAIIATSLSMRLPLDIERYRINRSVTTLNLSSDFIRLWVMNHLNKNKLKIITDKNGKVEIDIKNLSTIIPGQDIAVELYDLQSKFNVNNLNDKKLHIYFLNLLEEIFPEKDPVQLKVLLNNIYMWIQPFKQHHIQFDEKYTKYTPPYFPAHQRMHSISELKLVKGMDLQTYQLLYPYITALPEITPINVNSASKTLLTSLGNGISAEIADKIIEKRGKHGFKNTALMQNTLREFNIPIFYTTIFSKYFLCKITVADDNHSITKYLILKRETKKNQKITTQLISEFNNCL